MKFKNILYKVLAFVIIFFIVSTFIVIKELLSKSNIEDFVSLIISPLNILIIVILFFLYEFSEYLLDKNNVKIKYFYILLFKISNFIILFTLMIVFLRTAELFTNTISVTLEDFFNFLFNSISTLFLIIALINIFVLIYFNKSKDSKNTTKSINNLYLINSMFVFYIFIELISKAKGV